VKTPVLELTHLKELKTEYVHRKKLPFAAEKDHAAFQREVILTLMEEINARRTKDIPVSNRYVFQHGRKWDFQQQSKEGFRPKSGELELAGTTTSIELRRILANDVTLIHEFIEKMSAGIDERMQRTLFAEMASAAEQSGNSFTIPKDGITGELFLELIRSTEVHVGEDGKVSRPSLFLHPDMYEKVVAPLEKLGPEFKAKADALWLEKEQEALKREQERVSKFEESE
jgi:hypothetical protein